MEFYGLILMHVVCVVGAERKGRTFVVRSDGGLSYGLNGRGGRAEQLITNAVAVSILYSLIIIVTHMIDYLLVEMCLN